MNAFKYEICRQFDSRLAATCLLWSTGNTCDLSHGFKFYPIISDRMFESQVDPKIGFKMLMIHPDVQEIPFARVSLNHRASVTMTLLLVAGFAVVVGVGGGRVRGIIHRG